MSNDYCLLRKDRQGFYVPVIGKENEKDLPVVTGLDPRFKEMFDALDFISSSYPHMKMKIGVECYVDFLPTLKGRHKHYFGCPQSSNDSMIRSLKCSCERVYDEWVKDYTKEAR